MVKVTLLRPYAHSEDGSVSISGGQVSPLDAIATHVSINPADPAFQQPFNQDPNVQTYGRREGPLTKIDLHQNIVYTLSMTPGQESTLMPYGIAKIHFGDPELGPGMQDGVNPRVTMQTERVRVAMNWGDFERFPFVRRTPEGKIIADTRIIGPPKVPYVSIVEIDQRGNETGDAWQPWEFYKWEQMVDRQAAAEAKRRLQDEGFAIPSQPVAPDIAALVAAEVERRLSEKKVAHVKP